MLYKMGVFIMSNLSEKLYAELEEAKQTIENQKTEIYDLKEQMRTLAYDLTGVEEIVSLFGSSKHYSESPSSASAFNNIARLVSDIASSLEATVNDEYYYIG
jgi:ribosomal protein S6